MARRAPPKPVSAHVYRHFAVFTIAVTLVVGVFADGESRKAVASEVRAAQPNPAATQRPATLVRKDSGRRASFEAGDGFDGNFGAPMDSVGAAAHDGVVPNDYAPAPAPGVPAGFTRYGVSAQVWAALTEEQKKALIARQAAEKAAADSPERGLQIEGLLAASRERSGHATPGD